MISWENSPLPDFMTRARREARVSPDFLVLAIVRDRGVFWGGIGCRSAMGWDQEVKSRWQIFVTEMIVGSKIRQHVIYRLSPVPCV